MIKTGAKCSGMRKYFFSFGIFILLYVVGTVLPLEVTPHYYNAMARVWNWTEILVLLLGIYYIVKTRTFRWKQAVVAVSLGAVCLISLFRDSRTAEILVTSVCAAVAFYSACRLYELAEAENPTIHAGVTGSIRYFSLGTVISVPLAFLNVLYFSFSREIAVRNVLSSAVFALKPAIAEEVVFRFFLLAYASYLFREKAQQRFIHVAILCLLVIPHDVIHYPDLFLRSPGLAVGMCVLNGIIFGLPMALLMKKKNLQMAVGMHWFIDFVRFSAGF